MTIFSLKKAITAGVISAVCLFPTFAPANQCGTMCDPCADDCGFYVGADFLYWTACQRCLNYLTTFVDHQYNVENGTITDTFKQHVADYDWDVGFRAFAGYRLGCDDWELRGVYTYWQNDATGSVTPDIIVWSGYEGLKFCSTNDFKYQTADALVYREYLLGCTSKLRPFVGFRALWIDQEHRIKEKFVDGEETIVISQLKLDSDLFAAGMVAGIDWDWTICDGFGVYAGVSGSLLEADVNNRHAFIQPANGYYSEITFTDLETVLKDDRCLPVPGYHLNAGVSWESCFDMCGMESWLRLSVGYELNHWFHIPRVNDSLGAVASNWLNEIVIPITLFDVVCPDSSILLHGLTVRAAYLF